MSSKLIKGGRIDTDELLLRTADGKPGQQSPPSIFSGNASSTGKDHDQGRFAGLEERIHQLEREIEQRAQAAFQQGLQQGLQTGEAAARQQTAALVDAAVQRLAKTVEELSGTKQRYRHDAEQELVTLSLAIARRILHRELTVDPGAMLGLVKAALDKLDAREVHRIRVHPDHAAMLKQQLERMGVPRKIEVEPDASLERGAAILETSHGVLDASADTQLDEIERGFTDLVRHSK